MPSLSFGEIVDMELAKRALLLLAVDPTLGGVAIPASVGSGKSTLARAFARILPEGTPFVELPVNATEDRLLGGLDLEVALATGKRLIEKGLLAKAHGGVLYVDSLNLLDSAISAQLIDVMSRGVVIIEREGLSAVHPAEFMLVATFDPSDGDVRMGLLDRIGLIVPFSAQTQAEIRAEVVRSVRAKELGRTARCEEVNQEETALRALILSAREDLRRVVIYDEQLEALSQAALELGVEGNRVDVFAAKAAMASAALNGETEVGESDLKLATKLVLLPRATRMPEPQEDEPAPAQPKQAPPSNKNESQDEQTGEQAQLPSPEEISEMLLETIETELPDVLQNLVFAEQRKGKSGKRGVTENTQRGKYIRAVSGSLREGKLALVPTLMAAAPWQRTRQAAQARTAKKRLVIKKDDVRIKRFRDKAGTLFVFVVDSSGSMALNRMRQAKGAVASLLQNAYVHRDQVALIAFRGKTAEVLLPPSQSVERAKRELDVLPTGGGTPLAAALLTAWKTIEQMRSKANLRATLALITDGRANTALDQSQNDKEKIQKEIDELALLIRSSHTNTIVIDTQMNFLTKGEAQKLAQKLDGKYVYLPNARADQITQAVLS
ncbi:MAG: magnesium chelatase ATPase subunit D [Candidatus Thermochlorobacter sp.]